MRGVALGSRRRRWRLARSFSTRRSIDPSIAPHLPTELPPFLTSVGGSLLRQRDRTFVLLFSARRAGRRVPRVADQAGAGANHRKAGGRAAEAGQGAGRAAPVRREPGEEAAPWGGEGRGGLALAVGS